MCFFKKWKIVFDGAFRIKYLVFVLFVIQLFSTCSLHAQENKYMFSSFDKSDGLSNNNINCFLRDSKGFIWIGTSDGLNRFDGYSFKLFNYDPDDPATIRNSLINYLAEDYGNNIWIGAGDYLDIYDPEKETICHADSIFGGKLKFQNGTRWKLHKDRFGNYWWRSSVQGLYKYMVAEDSLIRVLQINKNQRYNTSPILTGMAEDSDGNIWIINNRGVLKKIRNKTASIIDSIEIDLPIRGFYELFIDRDDDIWINNNEFAQGVIYINSTSREIRYFNDKSTINRLNTNVITDINEIEAGSILVATDHGGLNIIDKSDFSVQYLLHNPLDAKTISENSVIHIYRDYDDFIWLGTFKHGVSYYHKNLYQFNHYIVFIEGNLNDRINDIDNFAEDRQGNLWIGTNGGGLIYFNRKDQTYTQYRHDPEDPHSISSDIIIGLLIDSRDNLWIGTYFGGLNLWNGKEFVHFRSDTCDKTTITDDRVWDICEDSDGMLWIATLLGGVNVFDSGTGKVVENFRSPDSPDIRSEIVHTVIEDKSGKMWFATTNGIRSYDKEKRKFEYYENLPDDPNSLSNNFAFDVLEDSRGHIWAATGNGLNILDKLTGKFTVLREKDGLPSNRILTIVEDNNHTIWAGTSKGISNIRVNHDEKTNEYSYTFINYNEYDGLQGLEFNAKAAFKTSRGELIFGGFNGFNLFHPDEITISRQDPNIVFTDFMVFNKSYSNKEKLNDRYLFTNAVPYSNEVTLKYSENLFTIEFSNLNYFHPKRNKYQYQLEGFNDSWLETSNTERRITYTNLDPGIYIFHVRVSNPDGTWNPKESTFKIVILPPWWDTILFKIVFIVILLALIVAIFYLRLSQLRYQKKILEKTVSERTNELFELNTVLEERQEKISLQNEELNLHRNKLEKLVNKRTSDLADALKKAKESDQLKSAFLANMSHEIRTPMNAIIGFSNLIRDEVVSRRERDEFIDIIHKNCESLLVIIDDILDLSKIEADQITIEKQVFNVGEMLDELANYYELKADEKVKIVYDAGKGDSHVNINHDKIRIKQVLQNLLDNALKFTEKGYVKFGFRKEPDTITFFVEDTGIGINPSEHKNVFVPFTKIEQPDTKYYKGTGLGLAICKRIATLMDGNIEFESVPQKGSIFRFIIPVEFTSDSGKSVKMKKTNKPAAFHSGNFKVLVAEDEEANYSLIEKILLKYNVKTIWAKNGKEAVDYVKRNANKQMVVLMDIKMPVMDGIESLNRIKTINQQIPVIAVTAFAFESEKLEILKHDFIAYISKPLQPEQIVDTIEKAIGQRIG
ncbi:MAG: response regulator [Bacteroidales bacterium]|nr:response regulator [Bacteroidales bacterium]